MHIAHISMSTHRDSKEKHNDTVLHIRSYKINLTKKNEIQMFISFWYFNLFQ